MRPKHEMQMIFDAMMMNPNRPTHPVHGPLISLDELAFVMDVTPTEALTFMRERGACEYEPMNIPSMN